MVSLEVGDRLQESPGDLISQDGLCSHQSERGGYRPWHKARTLGEQWWPHHQVTTRPPGAVGKGLPRTAVKDILKELIEEENDTPNE